MQVKRYEVTNIQEALERIKNDLGPDAIVLSSKTIKNSHPRMIEVVAAVDRPSDPAAPSVVTSAWRPADDYGEMLAHMNRQLVEMKQLLWKNSRFCRMEEELAQIREGLENLVEMVGMERHDKSENLSLGVYRLLVKNGVSRLQAARLLTGLKKDPRWVKLKTIEEALNVVEEHIVSSLPTRSRPGDGRRVKALVGPTGVGKTTTVAKLAARYHIDEKLKTGLITTDTYRIGAIDQLRTYAKILGIPLHVAGDREAFRRSLTQLADRDVIIVDTPGRSPKDGHHLRQLKDIFAPLPSLAVHLLLHPATDGEGLIETAELYRAIGFDEIVFTKLDECRHYGAVCDVMVRTGRPVSFVTIGQNVPEDIAAVSEADLARLIVRNSIH